MRYPKSLGCLIARERPPRGPYPEVLHEEGHDRLLKSHVFDELVHASDVIGRILGIGDRAKIWGRQSEICLSSLIQPVN
jgi:hypothetical protein